MFESKHFWFLKWRHEILRTELFKYDEFAQSNTGDKVGSFGALIYYWGA